MRAPTTAGFFLLFLLLLQPVSARAQGSYVSASLTGDIMRFSGALVAADADLSANGEAIGFALRAGVPIGASWGVEAEFARSAEIRREAQLSAIPYTALRLDPGFQVIAPLPLAYRVETAQRLSMFSASAWVRQQFTRRVSMVYLGGLAFTRSRHDADLSYVPIPIGAIGVTRPGILPAGQTSRTVDYGTHPVVGAEARIAMTDHVELVPGIRLAGLSGGWLVRPAVGIGWTF